MSFGHPAAISFAVTVDSSFAFVLSHMIDCHYLERARQHCECVKAGHPVDWQFEFMMRFYSWLKWSGQDDWNRWVRRASVWVPKKNRNSPMAHGCGVVSRQPSEPLLYSTVRLSHASPKSITLTVSLLSNGGCR